MKINLLHSKKALALLAAVVLALAAWGGLELSRQAPPLEDGAKVALSWNQFSLEAERHADGFRMPVAARAHAYAGLAAWEAALPGMAGADCHSLSPMFPALRLPPPPATCHAPSALNACYAALFQKLYLSMPQQVEEKRGQLEKQWKEVFFKKTDPAEVERSAEWGRQVALAVYEWSAADSLGHMAFLHNYDRSYTPPDGEGSWQPCADFPTPALLPYWGKTRTFAIQAEDFLAKPLPPYSTAPSSPLHSEALEVLTLNSPLSPENRWIAEFWSDDQAGLTFSSSGRWIAIASQVVEREAPSTAKTLETYLKVGLALSDAAVACWHSKYLHNLERPETFIRKVFQPDWRPVIHTPPFPAYPSAHAMIGAAAAEVLAQLYGQDFAMTDRCHEGRTEFRGDPRSFRSFREMALENAFSRPPLGVHFRTDCDEGLRLGFLVGEKVAALPLRVGGRAVGRLEN